MPPIEARKSSPSTFSGRPPGPGPEVGPILRILGQAPANACAELAAFINQTQAKAGKDLTPAQASSLIASATRIRSVIGCSK